MAWPTWKFFNGSVNLLSEFLPEICWEESAKEMLFVFRFDVWPGIRTQALWLSIRFLLLFRHWHDIIHIHTYIIGHYNSLIRITAQLFTLIMRYALILYQYVSEWALTLNDRFLRTFFMAGLFTVRVFTTDLLGENRRRNISFFSYFVSYNIIIINNSLTVSNRSSEVAKRPQSWGW